MTSSPPIDSTHVKATLEDPLVGQLLDGRYLAEERLAGGGMGVVYRALDQRLDRPVALKVMHPGLAADPGFVARFSREAKAAARLSHPNVVAVYDQGGDGQQVFLVMEYVAGRTLRDLLNDRGALTLGEALEVFEPVLLALGAAHRAGLVHRDVKPENVLLSDDGRVKVADFGLARAVSTATSATATQGVLLGTVAYLAPEQVEHGVADARSDVYAAGLVLFELLTGTKAYDGDNALSVAFRHVHEDVPAPSRRVPGLPAAVDALVARATHRDPDHRPADADRFLTELLSMRRDLPAESLTRRPRAPASGAAAPRPARREHTAVLPPGSAAAPTITPTSPTAAVAAPRPRRRWRGGLLLATLLVLAVAAAGGGWWVTLGPGAYTTAPPLVNLTRAEAVEKARDAGLRPEVTAREF